MKENCKPIKNDRYFQEEIAERNIEITEMMKEVTIRDVLTMTNGHSCHPEMGDNGLEIIFGHQ